MTVAAVLFNLKMESFDVSEDNHGTARRENIRFSFSLARTNELIQNEEFEAVVGTLNNEAKRG